MPTGLRSFRDPDCVPRTIRVGMRLDKYRVTSRLGSGGFATVYGAHDLIENRRVALKIPNDDLFDDDQLLSDIQREIRITARLDHPNILPLKDARFINNHLVMISPLGEETLADRMRRRIARATAIDLLGQMLDALSYAHECRVLHRDIKPENFILFEENLLQLTDFGLARIGVHSVGESASGTLGYIAPEQAMGKPTYRSDVFSAGLVMYRLLSGELPEYPFTPPLPGYNKLRRGVSPDLVALIRKAIDPVPSKRFRDGVAMFNAFQRIRNPLSAGTISQSSSRAA